MFRAKREIPVCPRCKGPMSLRTEPRPRPEDPPFYSRIAEFYDCAGCPIAYEVCRICFRGALVERSGSIRCVGGCGFGVSY